ncbi:protein GVQW3-like [Penaeus vannamei]|uniref:protein GVQW3-like n=1 Tax=Penaeus vannamei TaxID=6689 RepID=UPI00387F9444
MSLFQRTGNSALRPSVGHLLQRYCNGRIPQETVDEMKATCGEDALSYGVVKHWHPQFKCRRYVVAAPITGRPQFDTGEDTIHKVETSTLEDRRITIRHLAQDVKISVGSVGKIIHDHLQTQHLSARWVLRLLTLFLKE